MLACYHACFPYGQWAGVVSLDVVIVQDHVPVLYEKSRSVALTGEQSEDEGHWPACPGWWWSFVHGFAIIATALAASYQFPLQPL